MSENKDIWSEWLKHGRFGDATHQAYAMKQYKEIASGIINKAEIFDNATVLDVGAGDGLIGLTVLEKLGENGKLILADISEAALAIPKKIFSEKNIEDSRVEFLISRAEDLSSIPENSVDRVLLRSVILYIENKQASFNEIYRVLKKGGIAVIWEPINQRHLEFRNGLFRGYRIDSEPLLSVKFILQKVIDATTEDSKKTDTMVGYDEHTLVHMAIEAGFEDITLEYELSRSGKSIYASWDFFFNSAPNPLAKTLHQLMTDSLNPEEFDRLEGALKEAFKQPTILTKAIAELVLKK